MWMLGQTLIVLLGVVVLILGVVTIWYAVGFLVLGGCEPFASINRTQGTKQGAMIA